MILLVCNHYDRYYYYYYYWLYSTTGVYGADVRLGRVNTRTLSRSSPLASFPYFRCEPTLPPPTQYNAEYTREEVRLDTVKRRNRCVLIWVRAVEGIETSLLLTTEN